MSSWLLFFQLLTPCVQATVSQEPTGPFLHLDFPCASVFVKTSLAVFDPDHQEWVQVQENLLNRKEVPWLYSSPFRLAADYPKRLHVRYPAHLSKRYCQQTFRVVVRYIVDKEHHTLNTNTFQFST